MWPCETEDADAHYSAGSAGRVAEAPFLIVVGTDCTSAALNEKLAVVVANLFVLNSDAAAPIVRDVDLAAVGGQHNVILIGTPDCQALRVNELLAGTFEFSPDLSHLTVQPQK